MDFPVFHIFRASTPLAVHNVCENHEWDGMYMRLRFYQDFLEKYLATSPGDRQRLFIVSDGMDVIFNVPPLHGSHKPRLASIHNHWGKSRIAMSTP